MGEPVYDHCGGHGQDGDQDCHQDHAARHAENAGQHGSGEHGDEYDGRSHPMATGCGEAANRNRLARAA